MPFDFDPGSGGGGDCPTCGGRGFTLALLVMTDGECVQAIPCSAECAAGQEFASAVRRMADEARAEYRQQGFRRVDEILESIIKRRKDDD